VDGPIRGVGQRDHAPARQGERVAGGSAGEQVGADEIGHVARPGSSSDIGQGAVVADPAVLDHQDAIGQGVGIDRVVGDHEPYARERSQVGSEVVADGVPGARVEGGEGLVEQQHLG
jgi:NDP-sugar pyrophosphorylase family protein